MAPMMGRVVEPPPDPGEIVIGLDEEVTLPDGVGLGDLCGFGEWLGDGALFTIVSARD